MLANLRRASAPGHSRPPGPAGRGPGRVRGDEEGSTTVELVILLPVVFGLIFLGVQAGMIFHARQVALAAANQGVVAASVEGGTAQEGHAAADGFLAQVGGSVLSSWNVSATRDEGRSTITVRARPYAILTVLAPEVSATAAMPTETVRGAP